MQKRGSFIFVVLILVLLILIIFAPNLGREIRGFLESATPSDASLESLVLENQILKTELEILKSYKESWPKSENYLQAAVYSRYPFNLKDEILINVGREQGVREGAAIVLGYDLSKESDRLSEILVGRVKKVLKNSSLVTTIFDPSWRMEVRIGKTGIESLLQGGTNPTLTLIQQGAEIFSGDSVYNSDSRYNFGLTLGEVKNVRLASDQLWQEADLNPVYDLNKIKFVWVSKELND